MLLIRRPTRSPPCPAAEGGCWRPRHCLRHPARRLRHHRQSRMPSSRGTRVVPTRLRPSARARWPRRNARTGAASSVPCESRWQGGVATKCKGAACSQPADLARRRARHGRARGRRCPCRLDHRGHLSHLDPPVAGARSWLQSPSRAARPPPIRSPADPSVPRPAARHCPSRSRRCRTSTARPDLPASRSCRPPSAPLRVCRRAPSASAAAGAARAPYACVCSAACVRHAQSARPIARDCRPHPRRRCPGRAAARRRAAAAACGGAWHPGRCHRRHC
mmetsp:Transcript_4065/g.16291  ORF Transcript_4065/g.16291 Transcript_4065/m.16291 type:complete len:277 (+) Transcript_4065:48-878(+)